MMGPHRSIGPANTTAMQLRTEAALLSEYARSKGPALNPRNARDVARDIARTEAYVTSRRERKKIEMLFARLKRILRLDRLQAEKVHEMVRREGLGR